MDLPAPDRLSRQLAFILEIDRLKGVLRRTLLADGSRRENSAEHSWHIAIAAVLLAEHAAADVELGRVVRMLLVHDVVEIDAGDTYAYDAGAHADKSDREHACAERLFALLPPDQEREMWDLWREFEAADSPEARFANAIDRLMPMLHNYVTRGTAWQEHGVRSGQVVERNRATIDTGAPELWAYAERMVAAAVERGFLTE
jgi:putative hydrolases of HD superfamily